MAKTNQWVNSNLEGETLTLFRRLRSHYGIAYNSEMIRMLIHNEARRLGLADDAAEVVATATMEPGL
jgi:hypothetical protein